MTCRPQMCTLLEMVWTGITYPMNHVSGERVSSLCMFSSWNIKGYCRSRVITSYSAMSLIGPPLLIYCKEWNKVYNFIIAVPCNTDLSHANYFVSRKDIWPNLWGWPNNWHGPITGGYSINQIAQVISHYCSRQLVDVHQLFGNHKIMKWNINLKLSSIIEFTFL